VLRSTSDKERHLGDAAQCRRVGGQWFSWGLPARLCATCFPFWGWGLQVAEKERPRDGKPYQRTVEERLESWKEIAAFSSAMLEPERRLVSVERLLAKTDAEADADAPPEEESEDNGRVQPTALDPET
jgi:hypothetical protein